LHGGANELEKRAEWLCIGNWIPNAQTNSFTVNESENPAWKVDDLVTELRSAIE